MIEASAPWRGCLVGCSCRPGSHPDVARSALLLLSGDEDDSSGGGLILLSSSDFDFASAGTARRAEAPRRAATATAHIIQIVIVFPLGRSRPRSPGILLHHFVQHRLHPLHLVGFEGAAGDQPGKGYLRRPLEDLLDDASEGVASRLPGLHDGEVVVGAGGLLRGETRRGTWSALRRSEPLPRSRSAR